MPSATKAKETPLTDSEKKESPIKDMTADVSFDWDKLVPTAIPKGVESPFAGRKEEDVPERIRHMVEQALPADEYYEVDIPNEKVRGAFVQWIRTYCYVRSAGRLSSRVTVPKATTKVRYSVFPYKERKSDSKPTNRAK